MNIEHKLLELKMAWTKRGYSFEYWIDPPGQVWSDFVHDVDELLVLVEGEIEIEFAGNRVRPNVGDEVLIPARTAHTVKNTGESANRWCFGYQIIDV
jgi:mannose-6-phosphate isomerase-like protein (cupin superfamily)